MVNDERSKCRLVEITSTKESLTLSFYLFNFYSPLGFIKNGPYGGPEENFRHYRSVSKQILESFSLKPTFRSLIIYYHVG